MTKENTEIDPAWWNPAKKKREEAFRLAGIKRMTPHSNFGIYAYFSRVYNRAKNWLRPKTPSEQAVADELTRIATRELFAELVARDFRTRVNVHGARSRRGIFVPVPFDQQPDDNLVRAIGMQEKEATKIFQFYRDLRNAGVDSEIALWRARAKITRAVMPYWCHRNRR